MVSSLFSSKRSCLSRIRQDMLVCTSIIKGLWIDEKTTSTLEQSTFFLEEVFDRNCIGGCQHCLDLTSQFFKELANVGVDKVLFDIVLARKKIKENKFSF